MIQIITNPDVRGRWLSKMLQIDAEKYPNFAAFTFAMKPNERPLMGRRHVIKRINAVFHQMIQRNVFLLGEAGIGKTTIVRGCVEKLPQYDFFQVNLNAMGLKSDESTDNSSLDISVHMDAVIREAHEIQQDPDVHLVLFIDEIHRLAQVSPVTLQAIKNELADSGHNGMQFIFATTREEHEQYLEKDTALNERCTLLYLDELGEKETVGALESLQKQVENQSNIAIVSEEHLLKEIYDYTERYLPAQAQPRKSLTFYDHMMGEFIGNGYALDDKLVNKVLHDYYSLEGDQRIDPHTLKVYLKSKVFGQDMAIQIICDRMAATLAGLTDKTRPRCSMLLTGSTGVGKTEIVKRVAIALLGKESAMIRFDMTEYSEADSVERLRKEITQRVRAQSHCVLLFDEIEKAAKPCITLFLQVLDDGRLSDEFGRQVTFRDTYIFFTTNEGAEIYDELQGYVKKSDEAQNTDQTLGSYMPLIKKQLGEGNKFSPELLGRLDAVVPFSPLDKADFRRIAAKKLSTLAETMQEQHVELVVDERVLTYLSEDAVRSETGQGGGRQINAAVENEIAPQIGRILLQNKSVRRIGVTIKGELRSENQNSRESHAYIVAGPIEDNRRSV